MYKELFKLKCLFCLILTERKKFILKELNVLFFLKNDIK